MRVVTRWALLLVVCGQARLWAAPAPPDPARFEANIRAFEEQDRRQAPPQGAILFYGSSSIVGWDTKASFPDLVTINRGFGGSHMSDAIHFAGRAAIPYKPRLIVVYEGDNDLAHGTPPEAVRDGFLELVAKVRAALPGTRFAYLSTKPSAARWSIVDRIRQANELIREAIAKDPLCAYVDVFSATMSGYGRPRLSLFQPDGLHLNAEGYRVWTRVLRPYLD